MEINQCVGYTRQFFAKSFLGDDAAVLARSSCRNRHRHAIEPASRRWRGGRRDDSARTRRKILIFTQVKVEETDLEPIAFTSHPLDDARNLLMPVYGVLAWAGEPVGAEGQPLAWVTAEELGSDAYPMPPADYPLVDPVRQFLRRRERSGRRWRLVAPVRRLLRRRN